MTAEPSGADLARVALAAARRAAKTPAADKRTDRRKRAAARRRDGRDPMRLGDALNRLTEEHGWEAPAAGGNIIDQWTTIAPELAGKVAAERYDPATRTLHLRPGSPAYAVQLRMFQRQMVDRINAKTGTGTVGTLHVLAPGPITAAPQPSADGDQEQHDDLEDEQPSPSGPRTRDQAHPGYHAALTAALAHRTHRTPDPAIRAARTRQDQAQQREPADAFTDAVAAHETAAATEGNTAEKIRQAAIQRAQTERAGRTPAVPTLFGRTA